MLKKYILLSVFFLFAICLSAQLNKADRYFKKGDYIGASKLYETILKKEKSKYILEQLSYCYYNTYSYNDGLRVLKDLTNGNFVEENKEISYHFNFIYYHLLSATGDYEKAINELITYKAKLGQQEPDFIESKEKVESFRLKEASYEIEKVDFNSVASDYSAIKVDDIVYFTSDRQGGNSNKNYEWTHRPFLDLYYIKLDSLGNLMDEPLLIPGEINTPLHDGSLCLSADGNTMYFSRSNQVEGKQQFSSDNKNQVQLYMSRKVGEEWSTPEKLPFCSKEYNYQHPSLSIDGKQLFYSSDELGTIGSFDIYKVDVNDNGTFGLPKNLGNKVNTFEREQFPYIAENGDLYFSSNGHLGLGLLDVFVSKYEDGEFKTPLNLGSPINSRYDDFSYAHNTNDHGYFSSNRDSINDDVFEFKQIRDIYLKEHINFFSIKDSVSLTPVPNASISLKDQFGKTIYENILDENAEFTLNLIPGEYNFEIESLGFETKNGVVSIGDEDNEEHIIYVKKLFDSNLLSKNDSNESKEIIKKLLDDKAEPKIVSIDGKLYFDMPPIYFDFDRWDIRDDSKIILEILAVKLNNYPTLKIRINSHTDNRGSDLYNQILSEKRAESTRNYLVEIGNLPSNRISFKGYGESQTIIQCDDNCSIEMHQKNRRSEFELIEY